MSEYEAEPHRTLRQGDIVLAPSAILLHSVPETPAGFAPAPEQLGQPVRGTLWTPGRLAPPTDVLAQWVPVLVLSHDFELEKEFNERVHELLAAGMSEADAIEEAGSDPDLDPYVVVAPLLPYSTFADQRHAGIRSGQRIGCLPIDDLPGDGGDYVVDLFRPATLDVHLLPQAAKVASLASASVFELRYKISEAYASRDLAVLAEIEALVGHRITRVEALPKNRKKTALVLHLEAADAVHVEVRRPREQLATEITRPPRA